MIALCLGKLITCSLKSRLEAYAEEDYLIGENQNGFRKKFKVRPYSFIQFWSTHCFVELLILNRHLSLCGEGHTRKPDLAPFVWPGLKVGLASILVPKLTPDKFWAWLQFWHLRKCLASTLKIFFFFPTLDLFTLNIQ